MKNLSELVKIPKRREQLKKIVKGIEELAQKYREDDIYGDYYDKWKDNKTFEYADVNIPGNQLYWMAMNTEVIEIDHKTSSRTTYTLSVPLEKIKGKLEEFERVKRAKKHRAKQPTENIPSNLFKPIVGYDDVKDMFMRSIESDKQVHILLEGDPATAKTLFMQELDRLPNSAFVETGTRTSEAGLSNKVYRHRPKYLMIDEIADMNPDAFGVLKPLMENGTLDETISGGREKIRLNVNVYGTTNYPETIPYEIRSRFREFWFDKYDEEEFLKVCTRFLYMREDVEKDLAEYISKKVWEKLGGDVREARGVVRLLREKTREDVNKVIKTLSKYKR